LLQTLQKKKDLPKILVKFERPQIKN